MAVDREQVVAAAADKVMQAFYTIGLHMVGEDDGGVADMVEEELDFLGTVAVPMVLDIGDVVGVGKIGERTADMLRADKVVASVEPVCEDGGTLSHEVADQAAAETAFYLVSAVYEAFPEMGGRGLERHMGRAAAISRSHLRSEANFRLVAQVPGL